MNTNHFPIDDQELAAALENEDRFAADPRPEHIDELREKLLARTRPAPQPPQSKRRSRFWRFALPTAAAAALLLLIVSLVSQPTIALADVLAKTRAQKWVHGVMTSTDPKFKNLKVVFWLSPELGISAYQMPQESQVDDYRRKISEHYTAESKTIYKSDLLQGGAEVKRSIDDTMRFDKFLLQTGNQFVNGDEIVKDMMKSTETIDGLELITYAFRLEHKEKPQGSRSVRVLVDPNTGLLLSWEDIDRNLVTRFDYPATGPMDIYALGVPQDTKLVNRVAGTEVTNIAATFKRGRTDFDDYDAIVVQSREDRTVSVLDVTSYTSIDRVRRHGNMFRVDRLIEPKPGLVAPDSETDLKQWWADNRDKFYSVPVLICDGNTEYYYLMVDDQFRPGGKTNLDVKLRTSNRRSGYPDDLAAPWPYLMPEYYSRPQFMMPNFKRTFELENEPNDGPGGTIRVDVREPEQEVAPERQQYWLDSQRGYCVRKAIFPVLAQGKKTVAYVNTLELKDYAKSPRGYWYPKRAGRATTTSEVTQIREYYLDFDVQFDDTLFEPLKLD